jgi:hypothetical protein
LDISHYPGEQLGLSLYLNLDILCPSHIISSYQPHLFSFDNPGVAGGQIYTRLSHQYACQTGRSVETTLHSLVYKMERTLEDGLAVLGDFLAIESAFETTTFEFMYSTAEEHGVEHMYEAGAMVCSVVGKL